MKEERKSQKFYAIHMHEIVDVTGFETGNKEVWWCPNIGYSMWVGTHLFETYDEAEVQLLKEIQKEIADLEKAKDKLLNEKRSL